MKRNLIVAIIAVILISCFPEENLNIPVTENNVELSPLDEEIQSRFTNEYGMAIRYRFDNNLVSPNQKVTPPKLAAVPEMLDFIEDFWIDPYKDIDNGIPFFKRHVPAEIVFLGGLIYNSNGTVILGTADAGARITFTNVNSINPQDSVWRDLQLQTVYHEFAHTIHQLYKLPPSFEQISPQGYTSPGSWFTLEDDEALRRGFVSPYATSNANEDFAETVAHFLYDPLFETETIVDVADCEDIDCERKNAGRELIRQKIFAIKAHYKDEVNIDLDQLRASIQEKIDLL